jgi:spore maturation protein CgeB
MFSKVETQRMPEGAAQKKLLIAGLNNGWNLESSYGRAFQTLGWTVAWWDPASALKRVARGKFVGALFSKFVNVEAWLRKSNLELLQLSAKLRPDLVLVIATDGVRAGTLGQLRAQSTNTLTYCLFPDTPHNLVPDRIQSLPLFDRVITVSPGWIDAFVRLGARRVHSLPLAADPDLHFPVNGEGSADTTVRELAFVGNWRAEREAFLEQLVDFDLRVWGSHYWRRNTQRSSKLRSRWGGRPLGGAEFAKACAENRIMLNIIDGLGWPGPNMRTFEQPACRAFSLVTRTPAILELFSEGKTIECFDSVGEARDKIRFYLANEPARRKIVEASYHHVVNGGHTYVDRGKTLIEWTREDGLT